MNCLEVLLSSFNDFSLLGFCEDVPAELPAMSPELAAMREEIERFYYEYYEHQMSSNGEYLLVANKKPDGEEYGCITIPPSVVAELVRIHEFMLLRKSRERFCDILQTRDAVTIRIVDDDTDVPF